MRLDNIRCLLAGWDAEKLVSINRQVGEAKAALDRHFGTEPLDLKEGRDWMRVGSAQRALTRSREPGQR